ncbi:hypothetical protein PSENEW3n2_00005079 [Picochlorum sp. SENEW3]|nr:hypothetical protein PSENEW3n2_00005079 [Picochlorum sp. SENEW3]WPT17072.1 hypothetical protein PSENEW3_00005079 [Picochlorum sp. SENEW3]
MNRCHSHQPKSIFSGVQVRGPWHSVKSRQRGYHHGSRVRAFWGNRNNKNKKNDGKEARANAGVKTRKEALLEYVLSLSPATHRISEYEDGKNGSGPMLPKTSMVAIRQTISNLIGTLPPEYFEITISSREENLTQLMYSVLMTGYMFCNAHHRLELAKRLEVASPRGGVYTNTVNDIIVSDGGVPRGFLPHVVEKKKNKQKKGSSIDDDESIEYIGEDVGVFAAGTQKVGIQGEVLRWHYEHGVQEIPAAEYIEQLEQEVAALRRELLQSRHDPEDDEEEKDTSTTDDIDTHLARLASYTQSQQNMTIHSHSNNNKSYHVEEDPKSVLAEELESELLAYLKTLSGENVAELTECASADVMEAMNSLVDRLIGRHDDGVWKSNKSECTSAELGEILFWLMSVGHQLRDMEIRLSLTTRLQSIPSFGPDDGADEYPASDTAPKLPPGK